MITRRKDISMLHEIRQFIESNLKRGILVETICKEFGVNRTKLQQGFNQLYGISVHAFVSRTRMERARGMLAESDESVKVIAIECGYRSISSFTRLFRRQHGMSPTQYRILALTTRKPGENFDRSDN